MKTKTEKFVPYEPTAEEIDKALAKTISNLAESLYREQDKRHIRQVRILSFLAGILFSLGFLLGTIYENWQEQKEIISPIPTESYQTR